MTLSLRRNSHLVLSQYSSQSGMSATKDSVGLFASPNAIQLRLPNTVARLIYNDISTSSKSHVEAILPHITTGAHYVHLCSGLERRLRSQCSKVACRFRKAKGSRKQQFLTNVSMMSFPVPLETPFPLEVLPSPEETVKYVQIELQNKEKENEELRQTVQQLESLVQDLRKECSVLKNKLGEHNV